MNILLRGILSKAWAVEYNYAQSMLPFIAKIINGNDSIIQNIQGSTLAFESAQNLGNYGAGKVAVINISGPILKNDQFCGPVGTATIGKWIEDADANSSVTGIVLKIDSPGGSVDGTEALAAVVKNTKKPIVALVDGMAASAAYWIASAADEIIANGKTSFVGSIGTFISINDFSEALLKMGIKTHDIYATASTDKNGEFRSVINNEDTKPMVKMLDKLNKVFTSTVSSNRSGKFDLEKEDVLTGKLYTSAEAVKFGLVDSIGSLNDAINTVLNSNKNKNKMSKSTLAIPTIMGILGWTEFVNNDGAHLQESELENIEAVLVTASANEELLTSQSTALSVAAVEIGSLQSRLDAANTLLSELQATVATLGQQDAGATTVIPDAGAEGTSSKEWKPIPDGSEVILQSLKSRRN